MRISIRFPYAVFWFVLTAILLIFSGCGGTPYRSSPDAGRQYRDIHTVVLATPDLTVYEITTGEGVTLKRLKALPEGVRKPRLDWSRMAVANVQKAVAEAYAERGIRVISLHGSDASDAELMEVQALFRAVSGSIALHAYDEEERATGHEKDGRSVSCTQTGDRPFEEAFEPFPFPGKQGRFAYSVGSVKGILKRHGGRALVLVAGFDEIANNERKALVAAGIAIESVVLPIGVPGIIETGKTSVSVAVVAPSGDILGYSSRGDFATDLLNPKNADKFIREILADFP